MYLSIDPGKNNFGYCIVNDGFDIIEWDVIHWKNIIDLVDLLDIIIEEYELETILIEQQPINNIQMYKVMNYLEMYFTTKKIKTKIQSAKSKLKKYQKEYLELLSKCKIQNRGAQYRIRKKLSIIKCRELIKDQQQEWIDKFENEKKKDDLSDCYLQIFYFLNNNNELSIN